MPGPRHDVAPLAGPVAITGGVPAPARPAVVALVDARLRCEDGPADTTAFCSGVLVAPRIVLTAAHCVEGRSPTSIEIYFGDALGVPGATGTFATVVDRAVPRDRETEGSDLALVLLGAPAPVAPLPLAMGAADALVGQRAVAVGFGEAAPAGDAPGIKREGTVQISEADAILRVLPAPALPCRGDSGGPLLGELGGQTAVIGVVARADPSCAAFADVTRIDVHSAFIAAYVATSDTAPGAPEAQAQSGSCEPCTDGACAAGLSCAAQPSGTSACARPGLPAGRLGAACSASASCGGDACLAVASGAGRACFCYVPCAAADRCAASSPLPALAGHRCASDGCAAGQTALAPAWMLGLAMLLLGRRTLAVVLAALLGGCGAGAATAVPDAGARSGPPAARPDGPLLPVDQAFPLGAPEVGWFRDVTAQSGIAAAQTAMAGDFVQASRGSGVGIADLDGDGRPDLVITTGRGPARVYRNLGGLRFEDASEGSGIGAYPARAVALGDVDGDGDADVVLTADLEPTVAGFAGNVRLLLNDGHGVLADVTAAAGLDDRRSAQGAVIADLDGDGLVDLLLLSGGFGLGERGQGRGNLLYRNRGDGTFAEVATQAGLTELGYTWIATPLDHDGDGITDLFVGNDTFVVDDGGRPLPTSPLEDAVPDLLYRGLGPGPDGLARFEEVGLRAGVRETRSDMGALLADLDGDGRLDLYLSNYGRKAALVLGAHGTFTDGTDALGLGLVRRDDRNCGPTGGEGCLLVSWGAVQGDFDLDGRPDLVVGSGSLLAADPRQPVAAFRQQGPGRYEPVWTPLGWLDARAVASADLDGDGDLDLVVTTHDGPVRLFAGTARDGGEGGRWLVVAASSEHCGPRDGSGAEVRVTLADGRVLVQRLGAGGVVHSSPPRDAHFGLGADTRVQLDVRFASGARWSRQVEADQRVVAKDETWLEVSPRVLPADGRATASVSVGPSTVPATITTSLGRVTGQRVDAQGLTRATIVAPSAPGLAVVRVRIGTDDVATLPRIEFR